MSVADPFEILELRSDSPEVIEQLGSKRKFWFRIPDDPQPWLFKYTRENTGEDWSEKIAAEMAKLFEIPAARVELATFMGQRGCASRSFVETKKGVELIHGSEILSGRLHGYDKEKQWGQSDHCLENIIAAVEQVFPPRRRSVHMRNLASYIVLDALICNTDRHHDNWGLLREIGPRKTTRHSVAPSFDHASSLGRELLAERRDRILCERDGLERYLARGRGGIFFSGDDLKGENPLRLAIRAAQEYPSYFGPVFKRIRQVEASDLYAIVERVPGEWMAETAKKFCCLLLNATLGQLKEVSL